MAARGGSAREKAEALRKLAAEARVKADWFDSMATRWDAVDPGDRQVSAVLAALEGRHCRVLRNRLLAPPGQPQVGLDHLVVSVAGTYLIDVQDVPGFLTAAGGSLREWGGSWESLDDTVDRVRRTAEQLESRTTSVIDPVICLTGEQSDEFGEPVMVRGVYVVPAGRLASWLLGRPRRPAGADLDAEADRLAAACPTAARTSADPSAATPSSASQSWADDEAVLPITSMRGRHVPRSEPPMLWPRPVRPVRRRSTPRSIKLLVCLAVVLSLLTTPGQRLWWAGAHLAGELDRATVPGVLPPWVAPCTAVTDATVAAALGRRVYRYVDGRDDTCSWGYVPRPNPDAPGILRIVTGWAAVHSGYPPGPTARYTQTATAEVLTVPQLAAVPGSSAVPTSITQPMLLVLDWKATALTPAAARLAVTVLVAEVARHLPSGPGALRIVRH